MIEEAIHPAHEKVVQDGSDPSISDGVVCSDIGHDSDLRPNRHIGGYKFLEKRRQGTSYRPILDWVK